MLARIEDIAAPALDLLTPPDRISTTECAAKYRLIPDKEGTEADLWDARLTPYINGIQDSLDDPDVRLVIVPKPARTGGTVAAENHLFKRLKFGPLTDVLWYLPSDSEVNAYVRRHVKRLFDLHDDIRAKIGTGKTDDTLKMKVVGGRILEWLQLNDRTITGRDAGFIVVDEVDAANSKLIHSFLEQMRIRATTAGASSKGFVCSHMDKGWTTGVAAAWKESNRGIWYWPCSHCNGFSSPCPTAPEGWHMRLDYERPTGVADEELLEIVANTAGLLCPHCQRKMAELHKAAMNEGGEWVFAGQAIRRDGRVDGDPVFREVAGHWIHGTMSPWVPIGDLAKRLVAATLVFERTRRTERLRQVTAKVVGEIYEGAGEGGRVIDPVKLRRRAAEEEAPFAAGTFPREALFLTAAVDVGARKFDVMVCAWDIEGRSWIVERFTIWQREEIVGGRARMVDLRPAERQKDWIVVRDQVLRRLVPMEGDPDRAMPIAGVAIDTGGSANKGDEEPGGVTWKAREFARAMMRAGETGAKGWRLRLIKGGTSKNAPEVGPPREINKDDEGRPVFPAVKEFTLNVDKLKALTLERLLIDEDGPGYVRFGEGLPYSVFEELCGEVFIDGAFERRGPNEALDLAGYNEAVRILLQPERADIRWEPAERRPVWARLVAMTPEGTAEPPPKPKSGQSAIERMAALNRR